MNKISAIVTAYNGAAYVAKALDSISAQTAAIDEVVVIDDGSTDETAKIVAAHPLAPRYIFQENQGPGAARNRGILSTEGEFIAFLDCDDEWLPDKLSRQLDYLESHRDAVLVTGDKIRLDVPSGKRIVEAFPPADFHSRRMLFDNVIGNPSMVLLRRVPLVACGMFDADLPWGQDWELWMRLAQEGRLGYQPGPVILYRWHPENISHSNQWKRIEVLHSISARLIDKDPNPWLRPFLRGIARSEAELLRAQYIRKRSGSRGGALRHAAMAISLDPFKQTRSKFSELFRAIVGEAAYRSLRDRLKRRATS